MLQVKRGESSRHIASRERGADARLLDLVTRAAGASVAMLDERYTVATVMLERDTAVRQTLLVELLDAGPAAGEQRWRTLACDELRGLSTPSVTGPSLEAVFAGIDWSTLEPR
jgi:hypothetical protein